MNDHILVVDDDPQITAFLDRYLTKQGFRVTCAPTGRRMRDALAKGGVDLCVLDVGLPDADGFELMKELRSTSNLPIIVLSVRSEAVDRVIGLEFGADDYVAKPFEPRELAARIRSVLRRSEITMREAQDCPSRRPRLQFGPWVVDLDERTVTNARTGEDANLTGMEFDLLRVLVEHARVALSRNRLIDLARGEERIVGDRAVDVHVMRLRKKIEAEPAEPRYIKTVRGVGYCLADDVSKQG